MSFSWITRRSLQVSPRVRLVGDEESEALRRKLEALEWKPENGFLKDQVTPRPQASTSRGMRAA
jgi:hypothetical protein